MSTPTTPLPPAGSDGVDPLFDPNRGWRFWNLNELWMGPTTPGTDHYVPNVGDLVVDQDEFIFYDVVSVDPTTFVPTLSAKLSPLPDDQFSAADRLLSPGPGPRPSTYLIYIDDSVLPTVANVEQRLYIQGGGDANYMTLTIGSKLDGTLQTISAMRDQSGAIISQQVPLVVNQEGNKIVPSFTTTTALTDGEYVTAWFWSPTGFVVSKSQLMVELTGFIKPPSVGTKYITSIGLASPYLSSSDPQKIIYPLNLPLRSLDLMGIVNYSDGDTIQLPVDGSKFQMLGFDTGFVATVVGQEVPLVLRYGLSSGEYAVGVGDNGVSQFITKEYKAVTDVADGSITVKLFCYPIWVDAVNGYRLRWFLMNLDRTQYYDVTANIVYLNAFQPVAYGVQQKIQVQLNLQKVNGTFKNYTFTQSVWISLLAQGTERTTNWTIAFAPGQTPQFGINDFAASTFINQNLMKINLAMGETDIDSWMARTYTATLPLTDPAKETAPPVPNYFSLFVGATEVEFPISQWNQDITIDQALADSDTLFVRFFQRIDGQTDLQLAIAGFPIYQQN